MHGALVKVDETSRVDAGEAAPGDADTNKRGTNHRLVHCMSITMMVVLVNG